MDKLVCGAEHIDWNSNVERIYIRGYALIRGKNIDKDYKVKKSFFIYNGDRKFIMPAQNELRLDITDKYKEDNINYDYAGFEGFIDLSSINYRKPLSKGTWKIGLYLNANGEKIETDLKYVGEKKEIKHAIPKKLESDNKKFIRKESLEIKDGFININVSDEKLSSGEYIKNITINSPTSIKIKKNLKKNKRKFGNWILQKAYSIFKHKKIIKNRVVFLSDSRVDFTGNFEFIYNELQKRGGYEIKSMLKPSITAERSLKEMITLVKYLATSKYILLDDYYPQIYKYDIRDNVEVIQLWHATGAFKTFGFSRIGKKGGPKVKSKNHRNYTKAIVSSENIKLHYAEAFGISEDRVISTGVPRTDIFFDDEYKNKKISEFYTKYPMLKDKKVIMFAPTFRGSGQKSATYDFEVFDIKKLYEALGEEYIIISKLHPFIKEPMNIPNECKDFVIDLSEEREINDLLFITDILITDYSSVCFEYSLLNRPMIFFAYDLDDYIASRDFYYPYESFVPGPIARTTNDIIDIVKENKFEVEKLEKFRNNFFDHFDGKSTERVVNTLLKLDN
ncbi:CDP-glycerol glycerophosphotransferase family protein [Clostridium sp. Ade.TY]|uniref:CDP-glycerol glycerophosphotransferase family protein n=1 Tax=Clostridium sp. Ade.TY TaxID=1391647 RepID=UPI000402A378|nr:CDP-glycerol glycerophosphotransferase family protein [Clostridium sp. Ade.TY]